MKPAQHFDSVHHTFISGQSQKFHLTSSAKLFLGFFNTISVIFHVVTYTVGMMLFSTCIKLFVYTIEMNLLKKDLVPLTQKKCIAMTSFFFIITWFIATSLSSSLHPSLLYGEAFYGVLCDMLTVSYDQSMETPWYDINQRPFLFTFSFLLYYVQMSLLTSIFKMVVDAVIIKRSGICCMALISNESKSYNVTCPKCLVVEIEMEQIKKMRELRQSVA